MGDCVSVSESQMAVPDGERAFPVASIVRRRNKKKKKAWVAPVIRKEAVRTV